MVRRGSRACANVVGMATGHDVEPDPRWWRRPGPSISVLLAVVVLALLGILVVGSRVGDTLPEVGLDDAGEDRWKDPLAVQELAEDLYLAVIPECAAGPITRIALWDVNSEPYWEVSGPPRPLTEFLVGFPVEGFETEVEYEAPPDDALVRLVVFRRVGAPVGLRYRPSDLANGKLMSGVPLRSYTKDGWLAAGVCPGVTTETTDPSDTDDESPGTGTDAEGDGVAPDDSGDLGDEGPNGTDDEPSPTVDDGFFEGPEIDGN